MEEKQENRKKVFHHKRITNKEMNELTDQIDAKLHEFIKDGRYKDVLMMMGNLGNYSLNNQLYILMQKPEARTVHGMKGWNRLGRHITPGEKAITIFKPIIVKGDEEIRDGDGKKVLDQDGNPKKKTGYVCRGFQAGYVFDISQTQGRELKAFRFDENKAVEEKEKILQGLRKTIGANGYDVSYTNKEELGEGCYGLCNHTTHSIRILEGMSDLQEISTTVHECGHALAHSQYREDFDGLTCKEKREIKEVEAESIACVVCTYLGLDTQNFNFSYITGWADGDITKFRKNLDVISRHARTLILGIEKELEPVEAKEEKKEETREEAPIQMVPIPPSQEIVMG